MDWFTFPLAAATHAARMGVQCNRNKIVCLLEFWCDACYQHTTGELFHYLLALASILLSKESYLSSQY